MSILTLGIDDVSEETRNFKDKLSSKESQISAQQMKLTRQAAELDELQSTLNEALHKLSRETNRVLQLESDLTHRSEELRNEKLMSQNVAQALAAAQEKIRLGELEARDLQANLESLSHTSDSHNSRSAKLEREKRTLEARVRELDANLQQLSSMPPVSEKKTGPRPRSSSLSSFRITGLQRELKEACDSLSQKEHDLRDTKQSLSQARNDLLKIGNEKEAAGRKATRELAELRSSLEQKEEELEYWKGQQDDGRREEELMQRVEEDEAKIMMLEKLLGDTRESPKLKEKLQKLEEKLKDERRLRSEYEERHIELVQEKEDALDELEHAREQISRLTEVVREYDAQNDIASKKRDLEASILPSMPQEAVAHVERLLVAIERLRDERDGLRRDMSFLESESKFSMDALKAKLASPSSSFGGEAELVKVDLQRKTTINALPDHLPTAGGRGSRAIFAQDEHVQRLTLVATASAVVIEHLQSQSESLASQVFDARAEAEESLKNSQQYVERLEEKLKELDMKLEDTSLRLEATTKQRNDVMAQLDAKDAEREVEVGEVKGTLRETRDNLEQAEINLSNASKILQDVESERDSLALQVANLLTDLRAAQEDLTSVEERYSNLQSHQLSSMSSNEATRVLQHQIDELEMRVMRRTEQIGIHQHDIKRLETNLRLQEDRLGEMTTELEMVAAQKDAMVEDCADAREARDETLARLERLEVDMETRMDESDNSAAALVAVIFKTANQYRDAVRRASKAEQEFDTLNAAHQAILDRNCMLVEALQTSDENAQQATVALAVSYVALQDVCFRARRWQEEGGRLECEIKRREADFMEERAKVESLMKQLEDLENQKSKISDAAQRSPDDEEARITARHAEELEAIHSRLAETVAVLNELQIRHASASAEHHQVLLDASETKQELERRLAEVSQSLRQNLREKQETDQIKEEASAEISHLRCEVDAALANARNAHKSRDELQTRYDCVLNELAQVQQAHDTRIADLNAQSLSIRRELEDKLADLQSRFNERSGELDSALQETKRISQKLQESLENLSAVKESHLEELRSLDQERLNAESASSQSHREMSIVNSQLEQSKIDLEALREEKLSIQEELTSLEAEFQRSVSLRRYLESQAQDSERKIVSLTHDLERTQMDLAHSEKSAKAAEVNLSLQGAQHKREMADLQRELTLLRSQPNLRDAVAELEERNNEMEALLRAKCTEIEENDDRALEMLKENKKLASRVESLSRKVQNLQAKLTAAKASASSTESSLPNKKTLPTATAPVDGASCVVSAASSVPPVPLVPPHSSSPVVKALSHRIASGPSSLSRPKTPERKIQALPPVFKARTPERRVALATPPDVMASATTIGKKRPAPEDFEHCESVPPQGFTVDSLPSHGPETETEAPRVRRVLSNLQSGFTPVRHNARPIVPLPSPKRPTLNPTRSSPLIADLTNSPRAASRMTTGQSSKSSKRSWLGKIRGASTATGRETRF